MSLHIVQILYQGQNEIELKCKNTKIASKKNNRFVSTQYKLNESLMKSSKNIHLEAPKMMTIVLKQTILFRYRCREITKNVTKCL